MQKCSVHVNSMGGFLGSVASGKGNADETCLRFGPRSQDESHCPPPSSTARMTQRCFTKRPSRNLTSQKGKNFISLQPPVFQILLPPYRPPLTAHPTP